MERPADSSQQAARVASFGGALLAGGAIIAGWLMGLWQPHLSLGVAKALYGLLAVLFASGFALIIWNQTLWRPRWWEPARTLVREWRSLVVLVLVVALPFGVGYVGVGSILQPVIKTGSPTPTTENAPRFIQNIGTNNGVAVSGNVTIQSVPELPPHLTEVRQVRQSDGTWLTTGIVTLDTRFVLAKVRFVFRGSSILDVKAESQVSTFGGFVQNVTTEGYPFVELRTVASPFSIAVVTAKQEPVSIDVQ